MIKQLIQQLAYTGQELYAKVCKVTSVDEVNQTADVEPLDGSHLFMMCIWWWIWNKEASTFNPK